MERRDVFMEEIERLGRALGKIIADFFDLKSKGKVAMGIEIANQQLKSQVDFDIDKLISISPDELEPYLTEKKLTADHIEQLVEYIVAMADHNNYQNPQHAFHLYERSLELYAIATRRSKLYPLDRGIKEDGIKKKLKELRQDESTS